jgi:hypothetical protein
MISLSGLFAWSATHSHGWYQILLDFHNGLPYFQCCPPTKKEFATLTEQIITEDIDWDPRLYDSLIGNMHIFYKAHKNEDHGSPFDFHGKSFHCNIGTTTDTGFSDKPAAVRELKISKAS